MLEFTLVEFKFDNLQKIAANEEMFFMDALRSKIAVVMRFNVDYIRNDVTATNFLTNAVGLFVLDSYASTVAMVDLDQFVIYFNSIQYKPYSVKVSPPGGLGTIAVVTQPRSQSVNVVFPTITSKNPTGEDSLTKDEDNSEAGGLGLGIIVMIAILSIGFIVGMVVIAKMIVKYNQDKDILRSKGNHTFMQYENPNYEPHLNKASSQGNMMSGNPFSDLADGNTIPGNSPKRSITNDTPQLQGIMGELEFGFGPVASEECEGFGF